MLVALELHAELVVVDAQVAIAAPDDSIRRHRLHLLRHHTDIGLVAAVVAEAIEAEAVVQRAKPDDVVLERDVRAPATAAAAASTTAAAAAHPAAAATAAH